MGPERLRGIVNRANATKPDVVVLLGDFVTGHPFNFPRIKHEIIAGELSRLRAPMGVHAVLGNHDWWEDKRAQKRGFGPTEIGGALASAGITVMENHAKKISNGDSSFWLLGLGSQRALLPRPGRGVDDLQHTIEQITDGEPAILLAHEPDIFDRVPERIALTLSGHTHGGQFKLFGWTPIVPSSFGTRFVYGLVNEGNKHLVVSGGLGCTAFPLRLGVTPEITVIEVSK